MESRKGWFKEHKRHREAYYKNKRKIFYKDEPTTPTPQPIRERRIRIVDGHVVRAGIAPTPTPTPVPVAPTRPLPEVKLFRLHEFIQEGDSGDQDARRLATARKIFEVYQSSATTEEINPPTSVEAITGANERYYIATKADGRTVIGAVAITKSSGQIHHLLVTEKGSGYGKAVYKKLEELIRAETNPEMFYCYVRAGNNIGKRFWASVGFSHEGWGSDRSYKYIKRFEVRRDTSREERRPFRVDDI